ncbi:LOW QUALITY PROTEIN: hypothetical protein JCM24511_02180 [Saitozyma sp. JCM 24511]|nr:LOW QUALITY PROTEIN: hypothetical protein JCM24511_02180 [Saitozyma sp. JCM 24511]
MPAIKRPASSVGSARSDDASRRVRFRQGTADYIPHQIVAHHQGGTTAGGSASQGEAVEEADEANIFQQRVLSLHSTAGNTFAASYYDPETRKLHVMEDTKDTWCWDLACLVMEQVQPTSIIMSTRVPDSLLDKVKDYCEINTTTTHTLCPFKQFLLGSASYHLASARLPDASSHPPSDETRNEDQDHADYGYTEDRAAGMGKVRLSMVKLGCWVNVDAPAAAGGKLGWGMMVQVCSAGALLWYLGKEAPLGTQPGGHGPIELTGIESLALSLAIFDVEAHVFMHNNKQKQAMSLFGILDTCSTPLGRKLLHTWHLRPLLDLVAINERHNAVAAFSSTDHQFQAKLMRGTMKKVGNIARVCTSLRRGRAQLRDWRALVDALSAANELRDHVTEVGLSHRLVIAGKLIVQNIVGTIDWDASRDEGRVCVRVGVDADLDELREKFAGHEALLVGDLSHPITVTYLPQLGHLVVVDEQDASTGLPSDWKEQASLAIIRPVLTFYSDESHYFKTEQMLNLDEHFGDIQNEIIGTGRYTDIEIEYIQDLVDRLRELEPRIMVAMDAIAELDCLLALAHAAVTYGLVRPKMTEEPVLRVTAGRHLLQELCVDTYIPNDTHIAGGQHDLCPMMIVTGANGSGKSAYGKQVALMAFMAQIGSFVPAQTAEVGVVDKIYTRVQTRESVSKVRDKIKLELTRQAASAFMIDLAQVSLALRGATSRSLIILDEFGKGTAPADGLGLLAGVIQYLVDGPCPRTVVLTHFHDLFTENYIDSNAPILYAHMETVPVPDGAGITYMYRLRPSRCYTSYAAECALIHGIPKPVVDRAREVTELLVNFEISKLLDAELTPEDINELQEAEELCRRFLSWEIDEETQDVRDILMDMLEPQQEEEDGEIEYGQGDEARQGQREQDRHDEEDEIAHRTGNRLQVERDDRGVFGESDIAGRSDQEYGRWTEDGEWAERAQWCA